MTNLLSSNLIRLPDLPSFSRIGSRRRLAAAEKLRVSHVHCPKKVNRCLGRWENEGGAIAPESMVNNAHYERNKSKKVTGKEDKIMKQTNHHEEMIRYGEPLTAGTRRKRGGYPIMTYNDRSPEVVAMNAHLRASGYPEKENGKRFATGLRRRNGEAIARTRMPSLLHLGQQYDTQARDNFIREAVLFALIVAATVWPIIQSVQAMAAR